MPGHGPIPASVRIAVDTREHRMCLRCGAKGREVHHRVRRRDGGHRLANCILLCGQCHRTAHANPADAKTAGYIVPPWGPDVAEVPVKSYRGWITLNDDGDVHFVPPPDRSPHP